MCGFIITSVSDARVVFVALFHFEFLAGPRHRGDADVRAQLDLGDHGAVHVHYDYLA